MHPQRMAMFETKATPAYFRSSPAPVTGARVSVQPLWPTWPWQTCWVVATACRCGHWGHTTPLLHSMSTNLRPGGVRWRGGVPRARKGGTHWIHQWPNQPRKVSSFIPLKFLSRLHGNIKMSLSQMKNILHFRLISIDKKTCTHWHSIKV